MNDAITRLRYVARALLLLARRTRDDIRRSHPDDFTGRAFDRGYHIAARTGAIMLLREVREIRADCDHDWDADGVEHEADSYPVSMDMHDCIHEQTCMYHVGTRTCRDCGVVEHVDERCDCPPDREDEGDYERQRARDRAAEKGERP